MSQIQWTGRTSNPYHLVKEDGSHGGHFCRKVSPGCAKCYSETMNNSNYFSFASHLKFTGKMPENMILDEVELRTWLSPKKETIFVNSMTDTFLEEIPYEWLDKVFAFMLRSPHKTFQILTKRPHIAREYFINRQLRLPPHIWFGATTEDQPRFDERVPELLQIPAAVRFLSCEPLLEDIDMFSHINKLPDKSTKSGWPWMDYYEDRIHWCILGGESGSGARECRIEWLRSLLNQSKYLGIRPFVKQLGSNCIDKEGSKFKTSDRKNGRIEEFPLDLQVREMP